MIFEPSEMSGEGEFRLGRPLVFWGCLFGAEKRVFVNFLRCLAGVLFVLWAHVALAADIHVNSNTNVAGDGRATTPYSSIQAAVDAAAPGDTVLVQPGVYREQVTITNSGTAAQPIVIKAAGPADTVLLSGDRSRSHGFFIKGASHITIDGFKIENYVTRGVFVLGPRATNISILDNWIRETGDSGIGVWGVRYGEDPAQVCRFVCATDILISGNIVERAANTAWGAAGYNEHITVANGVLGVEVFGNVIRHSMRTDPDYQPGAGGEGIDFKEGVANGLIHGNTIHNISKYAIYLDAGRADTVGGKYSSAGFIRNIRVFNNLIHSNGNHGIGIVSEGNLERSASGEGEHAGRLGGWIDGVFVYNNTIVDNQSCGILLYDYNLLNRGFDLSNVPITRDIRIFNNVAWNNNLSENEGYSGICLDHAWATDVEVAGNLSNGNSDGVFNRGDIAVTRQNIRQEPLFDGDGPYEFLP